MLQTHGRIINIIFTRLQVRLEVLKALITVSFVFIKLITAKYSTHLLKKQTK